MAHRFHNIRYTLCDMNGLARSRIFFGKHALNFLEKGDGVAPRIAVGHGLINGNAIVDRNSEFRNVNIMMKPCAETLHTVAWARGPAAGQYLCELTKEDGEAIPCPRSVAREQVSALQARGMELRSSMQSEFFLLNKQGQPVTAAGCLRDSLQTARHEEFLCGLLTTLEQSGVQVDGVSLEHRPGVFRLTGPPQAGVAAADNTFVLKQAVKEVADISEKYMTTFATCPLVENHEATSYFNFTVRRADDSSKNLFVDSKKRHGLSDTLMHWLGGLAKHTPALMAFYNPTVNCYRRYENAKRKANNGWSIKSASISAYRLVGVHTEDVFLQSRLPTAACNPYLVLAATIAAGMDGLAHQLLPPAGAAVSRMGDCTLQAALEQLEQNEVLQTALGPNLVNWFLRHKRELEIPEFEGLSDVESVQKQIGSYPRYL